MSTSVLLAVASAGCFLALAHAAVLTPLPNAPVPANVNELLDRYPADSSRSPSAS